MGVCMGFFLLFPFLVILFLILSSCIKVVPQGYAVNVERLGKYHDTWHAGLHFKMPIIDRVFRKISLKEQVCDFDPQPVITKDNVTISIDSVVYMTVFDPKAYQYGIENAMSGLANLTATNLRSIVGEMELDMTLSGRDIINSKMQMALDTATDPWGIKVTRVEVKNIQPPREIEEVMTKQMRAERERRETVLQAEAHQESIVKRAEGDKRAKVLAAEAERDAQIAIAQGKAESVKLVYKAEAEGLEMLKSANVNDTVLKLRGLEALKTVADGRATKIFLPTDISATVSSLGALTEAVGIGDYTKIDRTPKESVQRPVDPCLNEHSTSVTLEAAGKSNQIADDIEHRQ